MEIALISAWIAEGADLEKPLKAYEAESEFAAWLKRKSNVCMPARSRLMNLSLLRKGSGGNQYTFLTLGQSTYDSPALFASFYVAQEYDPLKLEELSKVKEQLVSLNLMNMPVGDEVIATISQFANLEKLNLNGTNVSGAKLSELSKLPKLKSLALSSTAVDVEALNSVLLSSRSWKFSFGTPALKQKTFSSCRKTIQPLAFYQGFIPDNTERLKLSMPSLLNKKSVLASSDKVRFKTAFQVHR